MLEHLFKRFDFSTYQFKKHLTGLLITSEPLLLLLLEVSQLDPNAYRNTGKRLSG